MFGLFNPRCPNCGRKTKIVRDGLAGYYTCIYCNKEARRIKKQNEKIKKLEKKLKKRRREHE